MTGFAEPILYLSRRQVEIACRDIDPVAAVEEAFELHARGETVLPTESHLAWSNGAGAHARSLSMPAYLADGVGVAGVKVINASRANVSRGLPRASGLTLVFDPETGRPLAVMDAAHLSSLRTAAATVIAAKLLAVPGAERLAIIGAGELGRAHLDLLTDRMPSLRQVTLCDLRVERSARLAGELASSLQRRGVELRLHRSAEKAIAQAQIVVPATTATSGYIRLDWLAPGALLVNVSLDDPLPEVILAADRLIVDDWGIVAGDRRRLLGRMSRCGAVVGPEGEGTAGPAEPARTANGRPKRVDAELGQILIGAREGRRRADELIVVNPFGLAIADVCLAKAVLDEARERHLGVSLER
jgi:ornithine cyclodeaminase/alanine dehydrogenase-like protein (mu-crystallin family)